MICRVCGQEKERSQFFKVKHFYKYLNTHRIWCRECQKLYIEMKKQEVAKQKFDEKVEAGVFSVCFN